MRFLILLLLLFLISCHQKTIHFDVAYSLNKDDFRIENNAIIIDDFPVYFQKNSEKNYSKKSLIKSIFLIELSSLSELNIKSIDVLDNNNWNTISASKIQPVNRGKILILDSKTDLTPLFNNDKISLRLQLKHKIKKPTNLNVVFRFTGKQEKTNTQFRIIA
jgi:hypothetical protein